MIGEVTITEQHFGDSLEIAVHCGGQFVAVITRPCAGANWFLRGISQDRKRFRSRSAAIAAAVSLLEVSA